MAQSLQSVGEHPAELSVVEEHLLLVVHKNAVGNRRAAWRIITSVEQKEKLKGKEQLASYAREYVAKVEGELQKIRGGILALMDKNLVPSASTDESIVQLCVQRAQSKAERHADIPVVVQRQVPMGQTKAVEVAQVLDIDMIADVPVVLQRQVPIAQEVQKTAEVPQAQYVDRVVGVPAVC